MFEFIKRFFSSTEGYKSHPEAVIVSCFYNPMNSPYRLLAFQKWYRTIKHLNHRIIECLIGPDAKSQLPKSQNITQIRTESLLWHKETLLNKIFAELPAKYKYVFWVDADVLFTNQNWLVDSVEALQHVNLVQPFEYCIHLDKNQVKPEFDVEAMRRKVYDVDLKDRKMWRSFCANHRIHLSGDTNYDRHGHVGFAWGARREILDRIKLYDRALIGGADHILAHAAVGQIPHNCITKSFTDNIDEVNEWSQEWFDVVKGQVNYVEGDLYHIWHGDIKDRKYLKRIRDFTPETKNILDRDANGLHVAKGKNAYMKRYYREREVIYDDYGFDGFDAGFMEDMGYALADIVNLFGQPQQQYQDDDQPQYQDAPQVPQDNPTDNVGAFVESRSNYEGAGAAVAAAVSGPPDNTEFLQAHSNFQQDVPFTGGIAEDYGPADYGKGDTGGSDPGDTSDGGDSGGDPGDSGGNFS